MPVIVLPDTVTATVKVSSASAASNFFSVSVLEEMLFSTATTPFGSLVTVPFLSSENFLYASDAME